MRDSTRFKLFYFVYFVSFSGFATFRNVFLEETGLTGFEMGVIGALPPVVGLVSQPFWGVIADWKGARREILMVASAMTGALVLVYPLADSLPNAFVVISVGTAFYAFFRAPIVPIADSSVLDSGLEYGQVRAYGSVAFGVGSLILGGVIPRLGSSVIFYVYFVGMALLVVVGKGLPTNDGSRLADVSSDALRLVRKTDFAALLLTSFLIGVVLLSGNSFFSVYMRAIGAGDFLTGVSWLITTVVEAGVFVYALRFGLAYRYFLVIGALAYAAKYAVYGFTDAVPAILLAQILSGFSFASFYLAAVNLADRLSPETLQSTGQTLLWASVFGLGASVGQVFAGTLFDAVGVQDMFVYLSGVSLVAAASGLLVSVSAGTGTEEEKT
ncbi:MAG: MFS transporter [Halobacteria archaeon]|nr:MFS transporter [Halobacteria archaeon]